MKKKSAEGILQKELLSMFEKNSSRAIWDPLVLRKVAEEDMKTQWGCKGMKICWWLKVRWMKLWWILDFDMEDNWRDSVRVKAKRITWVTGKRLTKSIRFWGLKNCMGQEENAMEKTVYLSRSVKKEGRKRSEVDWDDFVLWSKHSRDSRSQEEWKKWSLTKRWEARSEYFRILWWK